MRPKNGSVGWQIAKIAGRQHGNITRRQLLGLGLSSSAIARRIRNGVLHLEYRGVYRVGHRAPNTLAHYAAAVLASGDGAVLCGLAAAYVYGFLRGQPPIPEVVTEAHRRVRGVIVHRARSFDPRHARGWEG